MLDYIWAFLILIGIGVGIISGNATSIDTTMIDSTKEAVSLCITMLGIMAMWTGLMEIAKESGLLDIFLHKLELPLGWLFPQVPKDHPAMTHMTSNILANILGLGWAATPMGLKAMKELGKLQKKNIKEEQIASDTMCMFVILNISSLQLIPVTIIAYRSEYGSTAPSSIILAGILSTVCSTIAGIAFAKYMESRHKISKKQI